MDGISVVVCCYNSALVLPLTLEYLSKQVINKDSEWEIIVVDNNSTDNTSTAAFEIWKSLWPAKNLRVISEPKEGLCYARKAGVAAALYDIIIFCDDDNLLAENYLQHGLELVKKTKGAGYGIWGGKPIAYFDPATKVPEWFEKEKANYVVGSQACKTGDISYKGYVWGAGMIILKQIYLEIISDRFPLLLTDRSGTTLTSGGDSEISLRALIAGYRLYYDKNLVLKHYIAKDKLTLEYNNKLIEGFSLANVLLNKYKIFIYYISSRSVARRIYYSLIYLIKYLLKELHLRKLTDHDIMVLHALYSNKKFNDPDFNMMRGLLKIKV